MNQTRKQKVSEEREELGEIDKSGSEETSHAEIFASDSRDSVQKAAASSNFQQEGHVQTPQVTDNEAVLPWPLQSTAQGLSADVRNTAGDQNLGTNDQFRVSAPVDFRANARSVETREKSVVRDENLQNLATTIDDSVGIEKEEDFGYENTLKKRSGAIESGEMLIGANASSLSNTANSMENDGTEATGDQGNNTYLFSGPQSQILHPINTQVHLTREWESGRNITHHEPGASSFSSGSTIQHDSEIEVSEDPMVVRITPKRLVHLRDTSQTFTPSPNTSDSSASTELVEEKTTLEHMSRLLQERAKKRSEIRQLLDMIMELPEETISSNERIALEQMVTIAEPETAIQELTNLVLALGDAPDAEQQKKSPVYKSATKRNWR
jgi:hypothetical protein